MPLQTLLSYLQYYLLMITWLTRPDRSYSNILTFRFHIPWVVKITPRTTSTEAHALSFLHSTKLDLPIPRLIWWLEHGGSAFTVMQRVEGENLSLIKDSLDEETRKAILQEVHSTLLKLSTIPQPADDRGKVMISSSGHDLPDPVMFFEERCGPFDSVLECWSYVSNCVNIDEFNQKTDVDTRRIMEADQISYVHPDLRMYNVIVHNGHVSAIIDWEDSGWFPSSWQVHTMHWFSTFGCTGWWFLYWRDQYRFSDEAEAAYTASKTFLIRSPV